MEWFDRAVRPDAEHFYISTNAREINPFGIGREEQAVVGGLCPQIRIDNLFRDHICVGDTRAVRWQRSRLQNPSAGWIDQDELISAASGEKLAIRTQGNGLWTRLGQIHLNSCRRKNLVYGNGNARLVCATFRSRSLFNKMASHQKS